MDVVDGQTRSRMMRGIRNKNTKPEILVRSGLFALGYRYRLHGNKIPGKPDIVLKKYNAVIFVNGCFWHQHDCTLFKWPKSNVEFWKNKLAQNKHRDMETRKRLAEMGWRVCTLWECALKGKRSIGIEAVVTMIDSWLKSDSYALCLEGGNR
ncbi:very short patch repair endonuclease [Ruficoccus sp. ZRK36]|uniref:very short patch repair endonuclease n=1 Tax=Ruficoccus sp. ZRK36 TaxID=2866311 RepID=UPI001C72F9C3|nr:very short patch repair endonuclease [Ruficoccus sp. ZRK36]QYY36467.1 very short patch repair endonuclease [Ruficoccus sp. ZRK36]